MENVTKNLRIIAIGAIIGIILVGCNAKASAKSSIGGRASPVSDFSFDLSESGQGIKITDYTGNGGSVIIPANIEDMPVVEINYLAFSSKVSITSIVVPDSVEKIGMNAFSFLVNLTTIALPNGLKVISNNTFSGCKSLKKVNLPTNLEAIHGQAFSGCSELIELDIPTSITSIKFLSQFGDDEVSNNYAFTGCGKLPIRTRQKLQEFGYKGSF